MNEDPLAGLTRRQLEQIKVRVDRQLQSCAIDGREGAEPYVISRKGVRASIMLCTPCFEQLRLPESRAETA